jgi:hypothetical protein
MAEVISGLSFDTKEPSVGLHPLELEDASPFFFYPTSLSSSFLFITPSHSLVSQSKQ